MSIIRRLTATVLVLALGVFACSGDDDSGGNANETSEFPDYVIKDELLVRVNSQPIYGRDLLVFTTMYMPGSEDSLKSPGFNARVLDGMIDRTLLWLEADAVGITVADSTMQWFVGQFINAVGGERALGDMITKGGFTRADLENMIRKDLVIRSFLENNVLSQVAVNDSVARTYYDQNPDDFVAPDSIHARHIILRASQNDTENDVENKKQTLRDLKARMAAGENFEDLAKEFSQGPSAQRGGDLGYFTRRDMVPAFSDVAFSLKTGEVSDVVETRFGYHLIKCVDKVPSRKLTYEEVEEGLKSQLLQHMQAQVLQNHLQRSRDAAIIERLF